MKYFKFTLRRMAAMLLLAMPMMAMAQAEKFYEYFTIYMDVNDVIEWPGIAANYYLAGPSNCDIVSYDIEPYDIEVMDKRKPSGRNVIGTGYSVHNLKALRPGCITIRGLSYYCKKNMNVQFDSEGNPIGNLPYEEFNYDIELYDIWQIIVRGELPTFVPTPGVPVGIGSGSSGGSGGFCPVPGGVSTSPSGYSIALSAIDLVDYVKGIVTFLSKLTFTDVLALLDSSGAPGTEFIGKYSGWFFKLVLGTEKLDMVMDVKTTAGTAVGVMMGTDYIGTFTVSDRGTITIPYSMLKEGWVYIFPTTAASPAPVRRLAEAVEEGVTFYGLNFVSENTVLADGTPYSLTCDVPVSSATYTKTIGSDRVGKRQGWLVPFDYTITAEDDAKFSFFKINMIANSPNPEEEASDKMWVFLKPLGVGDVLHANMPYVYKPKEAVTDYEFTTTGATLKAVNNDPLLTMMTAEDTYNIYGIYENTTATALDPFYYVNIYGTISYSAKVTIGPNRWIIRKTSKFGGTPSYAPEMHFIEIGGEDVTSIKNVNINDNDNEWYNVNGVHLSGKPAQKGIYIHNGRKEAVR